MYVHIVSHLPTSFASDVFSVASVLYVFKSLTNLLYGSSVLHLSAAFHSGAVLCVVKMFLPSASYRSYNPWRHVIMYLPVSVSFYGHLAVFLRMSFGWSIECSSYLCRCSFVYTHLYVYDILPVYLCQSIYLLYANCSYCNPRYEYCGLNLCNCNLL